MSVAGGFRLPKAVVSVRHVSAPVTLLRGSIFWHSCGSSAHQLTVPHDHPRHAARTNTNTSAATTTRSARAVAVVVVAAHRSWWSLEQSIFWHSCGSSAHQLTVPHDHPRHAARTNTNTSAATTSQISACCGSCGGRGASLMVVPGASWLRWSNLKCRNEAQGPQGAEGAYDRCCGYLPPLLRPSGWQACCCGRASSCQDTAFATIDCGISGR
jgi:hypothetical protein